MEKRLIYSPCNNLKILINKIEDLKIEKNNEKNKFTLWLLNENYPFDRKERLFLSTKIHLLEIKKINWVVELEYHLPNDLETIHQFKSVFEKIDANRQFALVKGWCDIEDLALPFPLSFERFFSYGNNPKNHYSGYMSNLKEENVIYCQEEIFGNELNPWLKKTDYELNKEWDFLLQESINADEMKKLLRKINIPISEKNKLWGKFAKFHETRKKSGESLDFEEFKKLSIPKSLIPKTTTKKAKTKTKK